MTVQRAAGTSSPSAVWTDGPARRACGATGRGSEEGSPAAFMPAKINFVQDLGCWRPFTSGLDTGAAAHSRGIS